MKLDGIALLALRTAAPRRFKSEVNAHLLDLEDDDNGDEFQNTQCTTTGRKSGRRNKVR